MNLYINGSNRKQNCYQILSDLKQEEDILFSLADKSINYCLGCSSCINGLENFCVIEDDMQELYQSMIEAEKIIIATPIYMNHITGILKNVIDRLNPFSNHGNLKGKKVYLFRILYYRRRHLLEFYFGSIKAKGRRRRRGVRYLRRYRQYDESSRQLCKTVTRARNKSNYFCNA